MKIGGSGGVSVAAAVLAIAGGLSGCTNRCKEGTALVSFELRNGAELADSLDVVVTVGSQSRTSTLETPPRSGSFEIDFAGGYPAAGQTLDVALSARRGAEVVGTGSTTTAIAPGCTALSVDIDGSGLVAASDLSQADAFVGDLGPSACAPANGKESSGCPAAQPVCDSSGVCRGCALHVECELGVCKSDGTCAAASEISFVDQGNAACSDTAHASLPGAPYCQIQAAIDNGGRPFVHVAGSANPYASLSFVGSSPVNVSVVGTGQNPPSGTNPVSIGTSGSAGVLISNQAPVNIAFDGVEIYSSTQSAGVKCLMNASATAVTLHDTLITGGGVGITSSDGCSITIDQSRIFGNMEGAMRLDGPFTITNTTIHANNGTGQDNSIVVSGNTYSPMLFAFDTIRANAAGTGFLGGISCPANGENVLIQDSIVVGNTADSGSQFSGMKCVLQNVVTGTDSYAGATQLTPVFVGTTDDHLVTTDPANTACCIDKINNPTTPNANHDADRNHRPKGAAWDIGAYEVQ